MKVLFVVLSLFSAPALAINRSGDQSVCARFLLNTFRKPSVDWSALDRDERLATLVSQISSLFMIGIPPTRENLEGLSAEDAKNVGWSRHDLRRIPDRAQALFPNTKGGGLDRLIKMAGYKVAPRVVRVEKRVVAEPEKIKSTEKVKSPESSNLRTSLRDRLAQEQRAADIANAKEIAILRQQVQDLVKAGLLKSISDLASIDQAALSAAGLNYSASSVDQLNVRAASLLPVRMFGKRELGGLTQLMLEAGLTLEQIFSGEFKIEPKVSTREKKTTEREKRARYSQWQNLETESTLKMFDADAAHELRQTYRWESRAIVERLLHFDAPIDFNPEALKAWAATADLAQAGLTYELVATLPVRCTLGFGTATGYRDLMQEYNITVEVREMFERAGVRTIHPEEYIPPQESPKSSPPVFDQTSRILTPEQQDLIRIFAVLDSNGFDLDVGAIRSLSVDQLSPFDISQTGVEIEAAIRNAFAGGWREWVDKSGGDADELVLKARERTRLRL